jgi:hypothetical protein
MRTVKLALVTVVVALGGAFAASSALSNGPAQAKAAAAPISCETTAYHPSDNSWSCASGPAGWYHACDYDVDGHRVRAHIDTVEAGPGPDRLSAWAPSQGCSQWEGISYGGVYILRIRTCTEGEGCSAWKQVH